MALTVYYYQYSDPVFGVGFAMENHSKFDPEVVSREISSHGLLQTGFNAVASQMDRLKLLQNNDGLTLNVRVVLNPFSPFF